MVAGLIAMWFAVAILATALGYVLVAVVVGTIAAGLLILAVLAQA